MTTTTTITPPAMSPINTGLNGGGGGGGGGGVVGAGISTLIDSVLLQALGLSSLSNARTRKKYVPFESPETA